MYRNFYRNFTAIYRNFTAIFSGLGGCNPPPPPRACCPSSVDRPLGAPCAKVSKRRSSKTSNTAMNTPMHSIMAFKQHVMDFQ